jgi:DNA helicase-2/ATP-dependent DNA helicase PcrA
VLRDTAYEGWVRDGTEQGEDRWANLMELSVVAAGYDSMPTETALARFLEEVALVSDVDDLPEATEAPTLLTLHSAKGLEFGVVFMVGMEEGILPHSRSFDDPEQMEEERRLCYVGVTRARERLYLLHAFRRSRYGQDAVNAPSRFLVDLPMHLLQGKREAPGKAAVRRASTWSAPQARPKPLPAKERKEAPGRAAVRRTSTWSAPQAPPKPSPAKERQEAPRFTAGQRVRHPSFGEGTVIESKLLGDDEEVKVAFPNRGIKTLLASFARLQSQSE